MVNIFNSYLDSFIAVAQSDVHLSRAAAAGTRARERKQTWQTLDVKSDL